MATLENDLTSGSVVKNLLKFSIPFILSSIVQSLYNIVDMIVVGKYIGTIGISGVNIGGQLTNILTIIGIAFCSGASILISQSFGAKNKEDTIKIISTLFTFLCFLSIILSALLFVFSDIILDILDTPNESYTYAKQYFSVTILGTIFIFGYNALSSVMRAVGNSKIPLFFISIACVLNIILDYLFVGYFNMEVVGVAYATIISQATSMFLCILYLAKSDFLFEFSSQSFKIHIDKLKIIVKIATPLVIQQLALNVAYMAMTFLSNSLGVTSSAALAIVARFNGFAFIPANAISMSISAIVAQNIGAKDLERAKNTMWTGMKISVILSVPIFLFAQLTPQLYIKIFNNDPNLLEYSTAYLRYFSYDYLIVPICLCIMGLFSGSGHTKISSTMSLLYGIIFRLPLAFAFVKIFNLGLAGIGLSAPISNFLVLIIIIFMYRMDIWKKPVKFLSNK